MSGIAKIAKSLRPSRLLNQAQFSSQTASKLRVASAFRTPAQQKIENAQRFASNAAGSSGEQFDMGAAAQEFLDGINEQGEEEPMTTTTPRVGLPAPAFECLGVLPDGSFQNFSLNDFYGRYLVLFFYPLDFTFVCPTEITDFSDRIDDFENLNCAVVGCSVDSHFSHLQWMQTPRNQGGLGQISIPLLADLKKNVALSYDCLMDSGFTSRALFIIDHEGNIKHMSQNDPNVGRNVDEVLRLVAAFQHADVHGVVCPSGWKPGQKTITPNPVDKLDYFANQN